jgi:hypothetical protein
MVWMIAVVFLALWCPVLLSPRQRKNPPPS